MAENPVKVLLVEDHPADARLIREMLAEARKPGFHLELDGCLSDGLRRLAAGGIDVLLLDLGLPDSRGYDTFTAFRGLAPAVPVLVLTGLSDEEVGARAVREGAQDYLVKGQFDSPILRRAIRYAIERKRAEERVREEKAFADSVLDAVVDTVFVFDPNTGRALRWNSAFNEVSGYADEEIAARKAPDEWYPKEDLAKTEEENAKLLRGEKSVVEMSLITRDGRTIPTEYTASMIKDSGGRPQYIIAVGRDVTERKGAERALRQSEETARALLNAPTESAILLDREGKILALNNTAAVRFYRRADELVGTCIWDILPPGIAATRRALAAEVARSREPMQWEDERGGRTYSGATYPVLDAEGNVSRFAVFAQDITERRRAEEELRWELAVSKALAELSQALIAASSPIESIANIVLDHAKRLTESEHGFVSLIDPKTLDSVVHTFTSMKEGECGVADGERRVAFPVGPDGRYPALWGHALNTGKAFYTNSPGAHPASQGVPKGHIALRNFLSVPAIAGEEAVGLVALANADREYTERDLEAIKRLTDLYALAVQRKRGEEALVHAKEQWERTFDAATDLIALVDREFRFVRVNKAMADRLGCTPGEAGGLTCYKAVHGTDRPPDFCPHAPVLNEGKECRIQLHEDRLGGDLLLSATPLRDPDGTVIGSVHVARDITDRVRAEKALQKLNEELEERVEERTGELSAANELLKAEIVERRRAEQALRQSEQRYRLLFDSSPVGIGIADADGNVVDGNQCMAETAGYSLEELRALNLASTYQDPDDRTAMLKALRESGEVRDREVKLKRKDGTVYDALLDVHLLEIGGRKLLLTTVRDITARKQAEEELRQYREHLEELVTERTGQLQAEIAERERAEADLAESERRYRAVSELTSDYIIEIDVGPDGRTELVWATEGFTRVTGYTVAEAGRWEQWGHIVHPDDVAKVERWIQIAVAGKPAEVEIRLSTKQGETCWLRAFGRPERGAEQGRVGRILGAVSDITDRKRAQEALRQSEERFRLAFEDGPTGMAIVDLDCRIVRANTAFCEMLGYTEEELGGLSFVDVTHPEDAERDLHLAEQVFKGEIENYRLEKRYVRKDRGLLWAELTATAIRDWQGKALYGLAMVRDVTAQKRFEQELLALNRTLEARVEERTRLVKLLQDTADIANEAISADQAFQKALRRLCRHLAWPIGHAWLVDITDRQGFADTNVWFLRSPQRLDPVVRAMAQTPLRPGQCFLGKVGARGRAAWARNIASKADCPRCERAAGLGLRACFALPLLVGERAVGVLEIYAKEPVEPDQALLQVAPHIGAQLGQVVERQSLQEQLIQAAWKQQRQFGQELHDGLCQQLAGTAMLAQGLKRSLEARAAPEANAADALLGVIEEAKDTLLALARASFPFGVDAEGLPRAVAKLVAETEAAYGVPCTFECPTSLPVRDDVEANHLFRICQENCLRLRVCDDGIGVDPVRVSEGGGMGLRIMRYRAQVIGATLDIRPASGGGTLVTCELQRREGER